MLFTVTVLHNITREDGRLAILARTGQDRLAPGDTLRRIGSLTLEAANMPEAADEVFAGCNGHGSASLIEMHARWQVRSLCAGDLLIIEGPDEAFHLLACTGTGWRALENPDQYSVIPAREPAIAPPGALVPGAVPLGQIRPTVLQLPPVTRPGTTGHPGGEQA